MKSACYVNAMMDMSNMTDDRIGSIMDGILRRCNISVLDDGMRERIMDYAIRQVESRFMYDYKAIVDWDTGSIAFMVPYDDYENGEPWKLVQRKGVHGGLSHDDDGVGMEEIVKYCEDKRVEYMTIALSYSIQGLGVAA